MSESLDDLAESGQPVQSTGQIAFMRNASQESKKRNTTFGQDIWGPVWEARGVAYPLRIKKMSAAKVVLMNQGIPMLAHKVFIGWAKTAEGQFPRRENARCRGLRLDEQGNWVSTGKNCDLCKFFGRDPRLVVLYGLIDLRQDQKKEGKFAVRRMEVDNEGVMGVIWNGVEMAANREKRTATTKYAMFHVARSGERTALAHGNQWTFDKWVKPEVCTDYIGAMPDWKKGYPIFSTETMLNIARQHLSVCEDHNITEKSKGAPSKEGVLALFGKEGAQNAPQSSNPTPEGQGSESLDDLSAGASPAQPAPPAEQPGPTLDDLDDVGGSTPPAQTTPETVPQNGGEPDTSSDDYDPWMDGDV